VWPEVTLGPTLQGCDVRCAQTKTFLFTSSLFLPPKTITSTNNLFPHPPTTQSIIMKFYITVIIFLSLIHSVRMNSANANAPATNRLRITSRGFTLHPLRTQQVRTINSLPRPVDSFTESYHPLTRLRFAASTNRSRVSVNTCASQCEPAKISSLVRVYIQDLVSITYPYSSLVLSLTFR
jgi:hypothetical protein